MGFNSCIAAVDDVVLWLFLVLLTQVLFMAFAVYLQHEARYPLAEAVNSFWAYFLTWSDHRGRDR